MQIQYSRLPPSLSATRVNRLAAPPAPTLAPPADEPSDEEVAATVGALAQG